MVSFSSLFCFPCQYRCTTNLSFTLHSPEVKWNWKWEIGIWVIGKCEIILIAFVFTVFQYSNMISWARKRSFNCTAMQNHLFSCLWMIIFIESPFFATHFSGIWVSLKSINDNQSQCSDYLFITDCYFWLKASSSILEITKKMTIIFTQLDTVYLGLHQITNIELFFQLNLMGE